MVINEDFKKIKDIVEKQRKFLSNNDHLHKEHYTFGMSDDSILYVSLIEKEQSSGSCWTEHVWPPKEYKILTSKVKRVIRITLSAILPKNRKSEINSLVHEIFAHMTKYDHTEHGYYGNYEKTKNYKITLEDILQIIKKH